MPVLARVVPVGKHVQPIGMGHTTPLGRAVSLAGAVRIAHKGRLEPRQATHKRVRTKGSRALVLLFEGGGGRAALPPRLGAR